MRRVGMLLLVLGVGVFLGACTSQGISAPTPVPTAPLPEAVLTPLSQTDYCVQCHTDKEALIETAKPEEKAPSESEGVG